MNIKFTTLKFIEKNSLLLEFNYCIRISFIIPDISRVSFEVIVPSGHGVGCATPSSQ